MSSSIFNEGEPHQFLADMYNKGYAIESDFIDPTFTTALFYELIGHGMYDAGGAVSDGSPGVHHEEDMLSKLAGMPRLREYRNALNDAITEVSGFHYEHLTYLTVRVCPVGEMSSDIHRNDVRAGPWLVSLVLDGVGSFNVYDEAVLEPGEEIPLHGDKFDPKPLATSEMLRGDAWGIYSREHSAPHAGGANVGIQPKVLLLLYGWLARDHYPSRTQG